MHRFLPPLLMFVALGLGCDGQLWSGDLQVTQPPNPDSGSSGELDAGGGGGTVDMFAAGANCGDGVIDDGETCDGACPVACDDGNTCTTDTLTGAAATCDAVCTSVDITMCSDGDGCCPDGCDASTDSDCSASCGDGVVDENETCDGNCPTECSSTDACIVRRLTGSPASCSVQCSSSPITSCVPGDGCCPSGCTNASDSDCGAVCGNDMVEGNEVCDGNCPADCDDSDACTADTLSGSAGTCDAVCRNVEISSCTDDDGCCPANCNQVNDNDCAPVCGNDAVEQGEACDGPSCPTECNDGRRCTTDVLTGSAANCDAVCEYTDITECISGDGCCAPGCDTTNDDDCAAVCGNGVLEGGETCDPEADCPTACDDGDACTADILQGAATTCDAVCIYSDITMCTDGDGCCPSGCNANNDDDCASICGNQVVEPDETCDPVGSCPMDVAECNDNDACTGDTLVGDPASCTAECVHNDVTACIDGDGCCPSNCDATDDSDCVAVCDNGVIEGAETCDPIASCPTACDDSNACTNDTLTGSPTSCTAECQYTDITMCVDGDGCCPTACDATNDSDCAAECDNGVVEGAETCDPIASCPTACDDSNACTTDTLTGAADQCTAECTYTDITMCIDGDGCCPDGCDQTEDDDCTAVCDNGVVEAGEVCDPVASCPTSCDDSDACTTDTLSGAADQCTAECTYTDITMCVDGDGCCPDGCDQTEDDDCAAVCDNGVVESGELCDPVSSCPTACDDSDECTTDALVGSAADCTAMCEYSDITMCIDGDGCCPTGCDETEDDDCTPMCGNGVVETGETCDPAGSCPSGAGDCNDNNDCTTDGFQGSAASCTAECTYSDVTMCINGDGCCPTGCTNADDDDCAAVIDCTDPSTWPDGWATLEQEIFDETNVQRTQPQTCGAASYGAQPAFIYDARLQEAARCHAFDMITNNFFSHTGSDGSGPGTRISRTGYTFTTWGENIAAGNSVASAIVNQWMTSEGHCKNIMNGSFQELGVGYGYDASTQWKHYSVQVFGTD